MSDWKQAKSKNINKKIRKMRERERERERGCVKRREGDRHTKEKDIQTDGEIGTMTKR